MPTKFADLHKSADDLFNKNFEHGKYSVEVSSKTGCLEYKTKGHQDIESGKIKASHESTFALCGLGKLKETFTPGSDKIAFDLENDKLLKDTKFNILFEVPISAGLPIPSVKNFKLNYANQNVNLNLNSDFGSNLSTDITFAHEKLSNSQTVLGAKATLDLGKMAVAPGYQFALHKHMGTMSYCIKTGLVNKASSFSIHNQVNDNVAVATNVNHSSAGTNLALAAAFKGACGSSNQFKIDDSGKFAVSHITPTSFGAKLTVSGEFSAFDLQGGNHKVGAGLKFDF